MKLTVLGATGSVGASTLDVVRRHPDRYQVVALTGNTRIDVLEQQCREHRPQYAVVGDAGSALELRRRFASQQIATEVLYGREALATVASLPEVDAVMAAIVGVAGLAPTLSAARAGKRILLANKEALVMAGPIFMDEVARGGGDLLPIDSEHNAVFQALPRCCAGSKPPGVRRILLTASGGPFLTRAACDLEAVTVEQAVAHPNWSMGKKISVDSATMMNKGLEVIEAHWLFGLPADAIDVVIHPQSVIHSMVEYVDGSILAQLGNPDMRIPIAHALAWPERIDSGVPALDLFKVAQLDFQAPDFHRFPCLALAYQALRAGGDRAAVLNAANEVAVDAFLQGKIRFLHISQIVESTLTKLEARSVSTLDEVFEVDASAHAVASAYVGSLLS
ncbi:MAG: 1-deoxy-D-xylulose-5-phosphate reductoisomerase [Rhodocyclaceae bacterium]|jgi:1-deoxy-D-xylulose-5-phosphate reductoisomerase|nr:1-deoxy-D-xylulose-5-phosphate reductoisomerase [Rhodocyclaceae bacterium]MBK6906934.1 1-deoxy-D-xylulose-5-phosphate reductoisomerase [Rhodocyclaceae bacterium]